MKVKEAFLVIVISVITVGFFFYKTIIFHQVPFPGDLLVSLSPYKTQSYLGYAPGGYPNLAQGMDVITEMFPWRYFTIQELKAGRIPFWNPHNFSGNLHVQNYQTGVFYPFNIFFFLFSFSTAWSLFIMLQPVLAILFMYLFLRSLQLNKPAAFLGGIAFAFSSYMTVWMEYGNIGSTMLWLPLVLFSLNKFLEKQKVAYFLLCVFALTMSFLAGYIQGVFYIYIVAITYVVYISVFQKTPKTQQFRQLDFLRVRFSEKLSILSVLKKQWIIGLCLIFILPILLSAFQILPTYDLFSISTRSPYSLPQISNLLQPLYYWVTIFVSDFFGNPAHRNYFLPMTYIERVMYISVPFIFFTMLSIVHVKNKTMRLFLVMGIIVLFMTTNIPFMQYIYRLPIPMISTTVPTRALSIFMFCMIIVASFGIDYWLSNKKKEQYSIPAIFLGIYFLLWVLVLFLPGIFPKGVTYKSVMLHNLVIPTILAFATVIIFYIKKFSTQFAIVFLFILVVCDLLSFFQKITPFSPAQLVYPQTPVMSYIQKNAGINRFWGVGDAYIPANFQTFDGTYSPEGNDPLHIRDYGILLASSSNGKYPDLLPRPDANIAPGYGAADMKNPYRQQILNLLGVKYILYDGDGSETFPENSYSLVWQQKPWQVYENKRALPRFFLTSKYLVEKSEQKTLHDIYTVDLAHTVLLNTIPSQKIDPNAHGTVSLISYLPDQVIVQTNTSDTMLLFLSDNYYHSWSANIDTLATPIYKADLTFRAIVVPKGKHTISFLYNPFYFPIGLYIAGFGVVITVFYSVYLYRYGREI